MNGGDAARKSSCNRWSGYEIKSKTAATLSKTRRPLSPFSVLGDKREAVKWNYASASEIGIIRVGQWSGVISARACRCSADRSGLGKCLDYRLGRFVVVSAVDAILLNCHAAKILWLARHEETTQLCQHCLQSPCIAPEWISRLLRLSLWHFMNPTGWPLMLCQQSMSGPQAALNTSETPLIQWRIPVGAGPSSKYVQDGCRTGAMTFCTGHEKFAINTRSMAPGACGNWAIPSRCELISDCKGQVAAAAIVHSGSVVFVQRRGKGTLGALFAHDFILKRAQHGFPFRLAAHHFECFRHPLPKQSGPLKLPNRLFPKSASVIAAPPT